MEKNYAVIINRLVTDDITTISYLETKVLDDLTMHTANYYFDWNITCIDNDDKVVSVAIVHPEKKLIIKNCLNMAYYAQLEKDLHESYEFHRDYMSMLSVLSKQQYAEENINEY